MIKCQFCQTANVANTLFCGECGTYLVDEACQTTDPLGTGEIGWTGRHDEGNENLAEAGNGPLGVRLHIGTDGREVEASLATPIHLGRLDPTSDAFPEVDLSKDGGAEKGVSRRHARIQKREGVVMVEDLGSINFTLLNGKRLAPFLPTPIREGDQLQLGKSLVKVTFVY